MNILTAIMTVMLTTSDDNDDVSRVLASAAAVPDVSTHQQQRVTANKQHALTTTSQR